MSNSTPRGGGFHTQKPVVHLRKSFNDMQQSDGPVQTTHFGSGLGNEFDDNPLEKQAAQRASIEINKRNVYM